MNNRRKLIAALGAGALAAPFGSFAQTQGKVWRVGFLSGRLRPASIEASALGGFSQGMRELGYVEGKNLAIEWRFAEGRYELFAELGAELVRLKVDAIVLGAPNAVPPLKKLTSTIPIVMGYSTDPVGNGFVASLARPGGNVTGLASSAEDTAPKHLELLASVVPRLSRVGFLMRPGNTNSLPVLNSLRISAKSVGLTVVPTEVQNAQEIPVAIAALAKQRVGALAVVPDALFNSHLREIAENAIRNRLPSIYPQSEYSEVGGLMSYGESLKEFYRRSAFYVDKILKGAKPADLPVEQPTKFELVVNMKTAKALGIKFPDSIMVRVERVIK
jgi:putative ABC transport system substrate-binding protein